jgi:hypothetical protein
MMKVTNIRLALLVAGIVMSSAAMAQAKYVWIDAQGVKQFSDTPPPGDIPEKNILKSPRRTAQLPPAKDAAPDASDAASADSAKPAPTTADKEADYKKRKAEQAEKDKKAAKEAQQKQDKAENCERAKKNLAALNSGVRMQTTDKDGQRSVMTDDQRAQETAHAQQVINNDCNN